jgi:hypothetical protein
MWLAERKRQVERWALVRRVEQNSFSKPCCWLTRRFDGQKKNEELES